MAITTALMSSRVFDLRQRDVKPVLIRVERALGTRLDRRAAVRKRRSVGARRADQASWPAAGRPRAD